MYSLTKFPITLLVQDEESTKSAFKLKLVSGYLKALESGLK
jgi:hypothetical protein